MTDQGAFNAVRQGSEDGQVTGIAFCIMSELGGVGHHDAWISRQDGCDNDAGIDNKDNSQFPQGIVGPIRLQTGHRVPPETDIYGNQEFATVCQSESRSAFVI
jgi:hypothetical protein